MLLQHLDAMLFFIFTLHHRSKIANYHCTVYLTVRYNGNGLAVGQLQKEVCQTVDMDGNNWISTRFTAM